MTTSRRITNTLRAWLSNTRYLMHIITGGQVNRPHQRKESHLLRIAQREVIVIAEITTIRKVRTAVNVAKTDKLDSTDKVLIATRIIMMKLPTRRIKNKAKNSIRKNEKWNKPDKYTVGKQLLGTSC